jgi:hypothetical protein
MIPIVPMNPGRAPVRQNHGNSANFARSGAGGDYAFFSSARVTVVWSQTAAGPKYWMGPG